MSKARRHQARCFVGTSGWVYSDWRDRFYPPRCRPAEALCYYATQFDTVEINATFYRLPAEGMVRGWRRKTPAGFVFAAKGPRLITHFAKLVGVADSLAAFRERLSLLGRRWGVTLWQLPPSLKKDVPRLDDFLAQVPEGRQAVEFRHPSWLCEEAYGCLERHGAAFCIVSAPDWPEVCLRTADFAYVRFHGKTGWYLYRYAKRELAHWAKRVGVFLGEGADLYAYFNNDYQAYAVDNARTFRQMLGPREAGP